MQIPLSRQHFAELNQRVNTIIKQQTWLSLYGYETAMFLLRVALLAFGFFLFAWPALPYRIIGMIILSYAYTGIAITGTHETSHLTYFKTTALNKVWAYFFSDFWASQSNLWWHHRHVVKHHVYPNIPGKETANFYYPWINRYVYFFVLPYLVVLWLMVNSVKYLWRKWGKLALYLLAMLAGWAFHVYLFTALGFSVLGALGLVFLMRSLFAPVFMHLAVFNHIGLDNPREALPWMPRQDNTTRNLKHSWILNGMGGNAFLECHLEHHLFPHLSNHMLAKVRPVIRDFLQSHGYAYREESYASCLRNCLRYYHEIFQSRPLAVW